MGVLRRILRVGARGWGKDSRKVRHDRGTRLRTLVTETHRRDTQRVLSSHGPSEVPHPSTPRPTPVRVEKQGGDGTQWTPLIKEKDSELKGSSLHLEPENGSEGDGWRVRENETSGVSIEGEG